MNARITGTAVSPWPMRLRSSRASLRSPALRPPRFRFLRSSVATGKPSSLPAPAFYILYISSLILCNFPLSSLQDSLFLSDRKSRNDTREFRASIDDGFIYSNYNSSAIVSSVIDILRRFTHPLSSHLQKFRDKGCSINRRTILIISFFYSEINSIPRCQLSHSNLDSKIILVIFKLYDHLYSLVHFPPRIPEGYSSATQEAISASH